MPSSRSGLPVAAVKNVFCSCDLKYSCRSIFLCQMYVFVHAGKALRVSITQSCCRCLCGWPSFIYLFSPNPTPTNVLFPPLSFPSFLFQPPYPTLVCQVEAWLNGWHFASSVLRYISFFEKKIAAIKLCLFWRHPTKMADILWTTVSIRIALSWYNFFWLIFHSSLFLRVQLITSHHWFRILAWCHQTSSHYLNQVLGHMASPIEASPIAWIFGCLCMDSLTSCQIWVFWGISIRVFHDYCLLQNPVCMGSLTLIFTMSFGPLQPIVSSDEWVLIWMDSWSEEKCQRIH